MPAVTGAGTVGAVINSLLAAGSGVALNVKGGGDKQEEEKKPVPVKIGDATYMTAPDGSLVQLNADGTVA